MLRIIYKIMDIIPKKCLLFLCAKNALKVCKNMLQYVV